MTDTFTPARFHRPALHGGNALIHAVRHNAGWPFLGDAAAECGAKPALESGWMVVVGGHINCMGCTTAMIKATVKHD